MSARNTLSAVIIAVVQAGMVHAQTVVRTTSLSPSMPPASPLGVWSGNSILAIDSISSSSPTLHIYGRSGDEVQSILVQIPGAQLINVFNDQVARSADGYVALSGIAYGGEDNAAGFLLIIPPAGADQLVVRTEPYVVSALAFSPDGVIWTAGREKDNSGRDKGPNGNYSIVRRFDKKGKVIGAALASTEFSGRGAPVQGSRFVGSRDRVGWFAPEAQRYIEFSLDGVERASYPLSVRLKDVDGVALCDDNTLWVSVKDWTSDLSGKPVFRGSNLRFLDRSRNTLSGGKAQSFVYLYGCAGNTLVATSATSPGWNEVDWLATNH
ncbi:MAG TPA: hypothetical protein VMT86_02465 [Bryobacteraceae bacterium]|nr:hypothetical protein [Bryobacteraceae bacterium]